MSFLNVITGLLWHGAKAPNNTYIQVDDWSYLNIPYQLDIDLKAWIPKKSGTPVPIPTEFWEECLLHQTVKKLTDT